MLEQISSVFIITSHLSYSANYHLLNHICVIVDVLRKQCRTHKDTEDAQGSLKQAVHYFLMSKY